MVGFLFLLSPIPGALGIAAGLIEVWLVAAFAAMAISGAALTLAAVNGLFPPAEQAPPSKPSRPTPLRTTEHGPDAQVWTSPLQGPSRQQPARANRR